MSSAKIYSAVCLLATSACLAAWSGEAEQPQCDDAALTPYGTYQCEVSTPEQLAGLAEMLNNLAEVPLVYLTLTEDLIFGNDPTSVSEFPWKPIAKFDGIFNGNGHTISGLNIASSDSSSRLGLFGYFKGTVRDLTIDHSALNYKSDSTQQHRYLYAGFLLAKPKQTSSTFTAKQIRFISTIP